MSEPRWFKSSRSDGQTGNCVEVAYGHVRADTEDIAAAKYPVTSVHVRDSKDQDGPVLVFTPQEWRAFTAGVAAGEFDV